ncbi:F-box protein At5g49610-like [Typha angustifolia]|uniref:F-box protein At5g49610-like n=1 Tax=Typha angustifolia TaxID=59011 RepID=UPI003C2DEE4C
MMPMTDLVVAAAEEDIFGIGPAASSPSDSETGTEEDDDRFDELADTGEILDLGAKKREDFLKIRCLVFPRLPAKILLRFRSVSPEWNHWISGPFLAYSHSLQPRSVSGLFFHLPDNSLRYSPFDPYHSIPNPNLSFLPEPVVIKSSTRGLLCCRGQESLDYYVVNPTTTTWTLLPQPAIEHGNGSVVAVVFDEPLVYNFNAEYHVVVASPIIDGAYCFESFSSATWAWKVGTEICPAEEVVGVSGVAACGWAYWRTTIGLVLGYHPAADTWRFLDGLPDGVEGETWWELGEMTGRASVTCTRESDVEVYVLEDEAGRCWRRVGDFKGVTERPALRSQGKAEVLMWQDTRVVVRDLNGRKLRELGEGHVPEYCADFIPYVSTLVDVKRD